MEKLTKIEIAWIVEALKLTGEYYKTHSKRTNKTEAALYQLRAEQLESIADKLEKAVESGSKRIEIK